MEFELKHFGNSSDKDLKVKETWNGSKVHKKKLKHLAREDNRYTFFSYLE